MKNVRILAVVVMVALAFIPLTAIEGTDSDGSSTNSYGAFNFWINYGTSEWTTTPISGNGYNACIALQNACSSTGTSLVFKTIDGLNASNFIDDTGTYDTVNKNYGTIDMIGTQSTSGSAWYAYYYNNGWHRALDAIGFYKPFSDYDAGFRTANMAFYYGSGPVEASSIPTELTFKPIIQVPTSSSSETASDFAVTFHIKLAYTQQIYGTVCDDVPGTTGTAFERLKTGVTITGYGSDGALALKNAMTTLSCSHTSIYTDVSSVDSSGNVVINASSYGYITKLFGVYEYSKDNNDDGWDDEYWYWSLYIGDGTTSYASYLIGWYSPLSNVISGFSEDVFTIHYDHSAW